MTPRPDPEQIESFRGILARHLGLGFDDGRTAGLGEVLGRRLAANGRDAAAYLARLEEAPDPAELGSLARELTVAETYFFRNIEQFRALRETVLPERLAARAGGCGLRVLSAGCASGEEAYSIAMVLRECLPEPSRAVSIRAVDVNPAVLEKAAKGHYAPWALRETPVDQQRRWFRPEGGDFVLDPDIRSAVAFERRNLAAEDPELWREGAYDAVFCRNVIMYFTPQGAQRLVARIAGSLAPGGFLFLGHAENLRGISASFHLRHSHETFYYQLREGAEATALFDAPPPTRAAAALPAPLPDFAAALASGTCWVEEIEGSAERVRALARPPPAPAPGAAPAPASSPSLGPALELLRKERFSEALAAVRAASGETDADALLLQALLQVQSGQLAAAEQACRRLLQRDELNAGAHYLLALCREGLGDLRGAAEEDQVAAYLDAAFAMPRLHLGLLARRSGDHRAARRVLGEALYLFEREDPSRILLFGGGFGREALLALARSELAACGGPL